MLVKGDLKSVINFNGGEIVLICTIEEQSAVLQEVQSILVIANNFIWGALFVGNFKFLYQQKHLNTNTDINIPFSLYLRKTKESVHASVKGGMKYNTGRLLMVLHKPLIPQREEYDNGPRYGEEPDSPGAMLPMP